MKTLCFPLTVAIIDICFGAEPDRKKEPRYARQS